MPRTTADSGKAVIDAQGQYEQRVDAYVQLLHANEPPGLWAKWEAVQAFRRLDKSWGEAWLEAAPALYFLAKSAEVDLHLALARLLESSTRSHGSLFRFLDFCASNVRNIHWKAGAIDTALVFGQKQSLEDHRATINTIMARRDKFFAHLDRDYFLAPAQVVDDFPLDPDAVLALANCVVKVISTHQIGLTGGTVTGNQSGFLAAHIEMMAIALIEAHRKRFRSDALD